MKKLLYMITAATVLASSTTSILTYHTNSTAKITANTKVYAPDTVENIIKSINNTYNVQWVKNNAAPKMENLVANVYNKYVNHHKGSLYSQKTIATNEKIVATFSNSYTNNSPRQQRFYTQSYSETITNQYSFSWKMAEKVAAKASFTVPFVGGVELTAEISSEQQTTTSITQAQTLTNPSQPFIVGPKSLGTVLYIIKQGTYHNEGTIRFNISLDDKITGNYYWGPTGEWWETSMSIRNLILLLSENGFADQIKNTSTNFSVISTNDPNNPSSATLNLPVTWDSEGGKLDITLNETHL